MIQYPERSSAKEPFSDTSGVRLCKRDISDPNLIFSLQYKYTNQFTVCTFFKPSLIASGIWPTWGPPGDERTSWILLSGIVFTRAVLFRSIKSEANFCYLQCSSPKSGWSNTYFLDIINQSLIIGKYCQNDILPLVVTTKITTDNVYILTACITGSPAVKRHACEITTCRVFTHTQWTTHMYEVYFKCTIWLILVTL